MRVAQACEDDGGTVTHQDVQELVQWVMEWGRDLTPWEQDFIESMFRLKVYSQRQLDNYGEIDSIKESPSKSS